MADRSSRARLRSSVSERYAEAFERRLLGGSASGRLGVLEERRREAFDRFMSVGFPTTKQEDWRFTPVAGIAQREWNDVSAARGYPPGVGVSAGRADIKPFLFDSEWHALVFVDGVFSPELSNRPELPSGVLAEPWSQVGDRGADLIDRLFGTIARREATPFAALNEAFAVEGAVIHVAANARLTEPIQLVYVTTDGAEGTVQHLRNLVLVEAGGQAQLVESYVVPSHPDDQPPSRPYWSNVVTEVRVESNAWVEHTRIQREAEAAYHIGLTSIHQERDSHYRSFTLNAGGALARHDLQARLGGENVETLLYGLYLGRGNQLVDNHTVIFHDHPHCRSWEVYKGILDDRSHAVFNGKVFVRPEAQKTDAKQTNRNLLLSEGAKVDTKPQLEIFADDVKCTHGATVGRIDEIAYYYLQSRGIPRDEAQRILTYAFAAEVVEEVAAKPVREGLDRLVQERMGVRA